MSEARIALETGRYSGSMHQPGVGTSHLEFDVVKGMQLPNSAPLQFVHYSFPTTGNDVQHLSLQEDTAKKIYDFSEATYVNGRGDFDCRAFLGYIMGWDADITTGVPTVYGGSYVGPGDTKNNLPYLVSQEEGGITPHAILGIERPGMSLGVAGFECPLIIADNADLLRAFGGFALLEVTQVENV